MSVDERAISVLIVSSGRSGLLDECLRRVREQASEVGAEIVVVVNAAAESLSPERRRELAALVDRLEFEPRPGKSHGLNRGVEVCRGEVIAFTDDDTTPHPGWLRAITEPLARADRDPSLVGCGGPVRPVFAEQPPEWYVRLTSQRDTHFLGPKHDLGPRRMDYSERPARRRSVPLGANCAYLRDVLLLNPYRAELGPNRETGLRGGEDFELGFRLQAGGWRLLYCPEACVHHPVPAERLTIEYAAQGYYWQGVERVRLDLALGRRPDALGALWLKLARRRFRMWMHGASHSTAQVRRVIRAQHTLGRLVETARLHHGAEALGPEASLAALGRFSLTRLGERLAPSREALPPGGPGRDDPRPSR